ncbi:hypothetical protein BC832DRAFT_591417 [Gaertneriomyces semiglobifer]|nr:hypothetical protein BC832DRAFT_591417 [Gaertneriomyces semiglobifer]
MAHSPAGTFCQYALGAYSLPSLGSCAGYLEDERIWVDFVSQLGYGASNALLAAGVLLLVIKSLCTALWKQWRLTASLEDAMTLINFGRHCGSALYACLFLAGFSLYITNHNVAWQAVSAACDMTAYFILVCFLVIIIRSYSCDTVQLAPGRPLVAVYIVTASVYLCAFIVLVASDNYSSTAIARGAYVAVSLVRMLAALLLLATSVIATMRRRRLEGLWAGIFLALATLIHSIIHLLHALQLSCDAWHVNHWFHFTVLTILAVHHTEWARDVACASSQTMEVHRAIMPTRIAPEVHRKSAHQLQASGTHSGNLGRREGEQPRVLPIPVHMLSSGRLRWLMALSLGCASSVVLVLTTTTFDDVRGGLPIALLVVFVITLLVELVDTVIQERSFGQLQERQIWISVTIVGIIIIATISLFAALPDYQFLFSLGFWPLGGLFVLAPRARMTAGVDPGLLRDIKRRSTSPARERFATTEAREGRGDASPHSGWFAYYPALRFFLKIIILCIWTISVIYGIYLPLAVTCLLVATLGGATISRPRADGLRRHLKFWATGILLITCCVALTVVLPAYVQKNGADKIMLLATSPAPTGWSGLVAGSYVNANDHLADNIVPTFPAGMELPVFVDVGMHLDSVKPLAKNICFLENPPQVIVVTSKPSELYNLRSLAPGTLRVCQGFRHVLGSIEGVMTSFGQQWTVISFEELLLNPTIVIAEASRGRKIIMTFSGKVGCSRNWQFAIRAGVQAIVVPDVVAATAAVGAAANSVDDDVVEYIPSSGNADKGGASPHTRWILAVTCIPVCASGLATLYILSVSRRKTSKLTNKSREIVRLIISHVQGTEEPTSQWCVTIAQLLCLFGWVLLAIGGSRAALDGTLPAPHALTYLGAVCGATSAISEIIYTWCSFDLLLVIRSSTQALTLVGAGHIVHALSGQISGGAKLALTGSSLFILADTISTFVAFFRYSKRRLEVDFAMLCFLSAAGAGWICLAVSVRRIRTDLAVPVGMAYYVSVSVIPLCTVFGILSVKQNTRWISGTSAALTVIAIAAAGGVCGDAWTRAQEMPSYHWQLAFAGAVVALTCLFLALFLKGYEHKSQESVLLRRQLRQKIEDAWRRNRPHDTVIGVPGTLQGPRVFVGITQNPKAWLVWRAIAIVASMGWVICIAGFGATEESFATTTTLASGILYSISAPTTIAMLVLALLQDAGFIAALSVIPLLATFASAGCFLMATKDAFSDTVHSGSPLRCIIIGCIVYLVCTTLLVCVATRRLMHPLEQTLALPFPPRRKVRLAASGVMAVFGWIAYVIGLAYAKGATLPISGAVLIGLVVFVTALSAFKNINSGDTIQNEILHFSALASTLPHILSFPALTITGATLFVCTQNLQGRESNGRVTGNRLIVAGIALFYTSWCIWAWYFVSGAHYRPHALDEQRRLQWAGRDIQRTHDLRERDKTQAPQQSRVGPASAPRILKTGIARDRQHTSTFTLTIQPRLKPRRFDVRELIFAAPKLQMAVKLSLYSLFLAWCTFISGFSRHGNVAWSTFGHMCFAVTGILSIISVFWWILYNGRKRYYFANSLLLTSFACGGYTFFWTLGLDHPTAATTILVGSLLYSALAGSILTAASAIRKPEIYWARIRYPQSLFLFSVLAWIIFFGGFWEVCSSFSSLPPNTGEAGAYLVFAVAGILHATAFIMNARQESRLVRAFYNGSACIGVWAAFASVHICCVEIGRTVFTGRTKSGMMAILCGALSFIVSQGIRIFRRLRFRNEIDVSPPEMQGLQWVKDPHHEEEPSHWLFDSTKQETRHIFYLSVLTCVCGWICYVTGLFLWAESVPSDARGAYDVFAVASISAVVFLLVHVCCRWTSAGLVGCLAMLACLATGGFVCASAWTTHRTVGNALTLAGCMVQMPSLVAIVMLLIGTGNIPSQAKYIYPARGVILGCALGAVTYTVGFVLAKNQVAPSRGQRGLGYIIIMLVGVVATISIGLEVLNLRLPPRSTGLWPILQERIRTRVNRWVFGDEESDEASTSRREGLVFWNTRKPRRVFRAASHDDLSSGNRAALIEIAAEPPPPSEVTPANQEAYTFIPYPFSRNFNQFICLSSIVFVGIQLGYTANDVATLAETASKVQLSGSVISLLSLFGYFWIIQLAQLRKVEYTTDTSQQPTRATAAPVSRSQVQAGTLSQSPASVSSDSGASSAASSSSNLRDSQQENKQLQRAPSWADALSSTMRQPVSTSRPVAVRSMTDITLANLRRSRRTLSSSSLFATPRATIGSRPSGLNLIQTRITESHESGIGSLGSQQSTNTSHRQIYANRGRLGSTSEKVSPSVDNLFLGNRTAVKRPKWSRHQRSASDSIPKGIGMNTAFSPSPLRRVKSSEDSLSSTSDMEGTPQAFEVTQSQYFANRAGQRHNSVGGTGLRKAPAIVASGETAQANQESTVIKSTTSPETSGSSSGTQSEREFEVEPRAVRSTEHDVAAMRAARPVPIRTVPSAPKQAAGQDLDSTSAFLTPRTEAAAVESIARLHRATSSGVVEKATRTRHGHAGTTDSKASYQSQPQLAFKRPAAIWTGAQRTTDDKRINSDAFLTPRTEAAAVDTIMRLHRASSHEALQNEAESSELDEEYDNSSDPSRSHQLREQSPPGTSTGRSHRSNVARVDPVLARDSDRSDVSNSDGSISDGSPADAPRPPRSGWEKSARTPVSPRKRWIKSRDP